MKSLDSSTCYIILTDTITVMKEDHHIQSFLQIFMPKWTTYYEKILNFPATFYFIAESFKPNEDKEPSASSARSKVKSRNDHNQGFLAGVAIGVGAGKNRFFFSFYIFLKKL